jgi:hypothetical protein
MTPGRPDAASCRTEGCGRPAEPGEGLCASCALENGLFHRELRWADSGPGRTDVPDAPAQRR